MPDLAPDQVLARFRSARVAHLATVTAAGHPHLVPVTFALSRPDTIVTAVDHKPKRTTALARLENIAANPAVSLLVDHYDEDWTQLWWCRADGYARVLEPELQPQAAAAAAQHLVDRYEQYADRPPAGPVIVVTVVRWTGWSFSA